MKVLMFLSICALCAAALKDKDHMRGLRSWENTKYGIKQKDEEAYKGLVFTVMSYNVLAQELLTEHQYLYKEHNQDALTWESRWNNLFNEIKSHNADILCLQEVQHSHLGDYNASFKALGYEGIYKQRTGGRPDGCAIYYKSALFRLVEYTTVEFNQPPISVLNRDNIAIIARFAPHQRLQVQFVVATTHLLYNPKREDVRVAQTQVLLAEIDRMAFYQPASQKIKYVPVILTGDFNSKPYYPVYELITTESLHYENLAHRTLFRTNTTFNLTGKLLIPSYLRITDMCQHADIINPRKSVNFTREQELSLMKLHHTERESNVRKNVTDNESLFSSGVLSHNLAFQSAFEHRKDRNVEATTFQDKWITVDYIFYSGLKDYHSNKINESKLKLVARYTIPTRNQLENVKIPNLALGSDHLSLIAKFKLLFT